MEIYSWSFEVGDVILLGNEEVRLLKELSEDLWSVHYLNADYEGKMFFDDQCRYRVVEVKG